MWRRRARRANAKIDFFGGEPLLHLDLVKQTVAYAREHGEANGVEVSFGMTTNGTLLTGDALEFLMQEDIGIMVSIDGPKKVHDAQRSFNNGESTYDIVAANTSEAARRAPEKVLLRTTMTNENLDMKGLVDELEGFKVNSVGVGAAWLSPHHPTAIRNEHLPELRRHIREIADDELRRIKKGEKAETFAPLIKKVMSGQLREYGCGGGKTYFGVDVEGDIYFCSAFGSMPEYKMGDVHNGIDPTVDARFRRDFHVDNKKTCSECWARYLCGGGCAYDARVSTGRAHRTQSGRLRAGPLATHTNSRWEWLSSSVRTPLKPSSASKPKTPDGESHEHSTRLASAPLADVYTPRKCPLCGSKHVGKGA